MRLLLFDIDGTLIRGDRAGRMAMAAALEELFGTTGPLDSYSMAGKTDARIIADLLAAAGVPSRDVQAALPRIYELMAEKAATIYPMRGIMACNGVQTLLAELQRTPDVVVGLLTGNACATSPLKLAAAGIDPNQFTVGAYGSDDPDRNRLPAIALARTAELLGRPLTGENVVIVGDTPADILCARAAKGTAVAVASGWHSAGTLARYHPDFLFDDLSNTPAVLAALLG